MVDMTKYETHQLRYGLARTAVFVASFSGLAWLVARLG